MDLFKDITDFHEKFGLEYNGPPRCLPVSLHSFRRKFMAEELEEYDDHTADALEAVKFSDKPNIPPALEGQLDALVDLVYVAMGTAYLHGFDFNEAWRRVHTANMQKVRAATAADSKRGSTFDVVKPAGWIAPRHLDLVEHHAHAEDSDVIA